jgi:peptidoglycan/LPS O-acetylase OafA/YrhL
LSLIIDENGIFIQADSLTLKPSFLTEINPLRGNRVSYLTNLTPMRGIAALLTVIFHIDLFMGGALVHPAASSLLNRMYLMVDFFFILSGFIMSYVYGTRFTHRVTRTDFKKFTIARFSRVYPLHFVMLLTIMLIYFLFQKLGLPSNPILQVDNNLYSVITNLLLLHSMNFHNWFTWVHASWSISTEWWAYMIFPFLVAPLFKLRSWGRFGVCLLCFLGYFCIMFFIIPLVTVPKALSFITFSRSDWSINVAYEYGFIRCLCGFILGMMMHHAYRDGWGKKILSSGWMMIIGVLAAFTSMHFGWPDIITVLFFPFLLLCGAYGSEGINKLFSTKPMQKLGDWSFSIYLVHQPLLIAIFYTILLLSHSSASGGPPPLPPLWLAWLVALIIIAIVLVVSYFTYRYIENPARRWLNAKAADTPSPSAG